MCVTDKPEDRISVVQMNSELRHAELELISAHCATHKLRLRFSTDNIARYGHRDVLRKSIETASALSEYYSSIEKQISAESAASVAATGLNNQQILQALEYVSSFLRDGREQYLPSATPLSKGLQAIISPYFQTAV